MQIAHFQCMRKADLRLMSSAGTSCLAAIFELFDVYLTAFVLCNFATHEVLDIDI